MKDGTACVALIDVSLSNTGDRVEKINVNVNKPSSKNLRIGLSIFLTLSSSPYHGNERITYILFVFQMKRVKEPKRI
jgi:hypothetical protein